jgi:hypothetical protein
MSEAAVAVLALAARGLDKSLRTIRITHALSVARCFHNRLAVQTGGLPETHRGCNTLQFGFGDLALVLPNRGVAMVYLAQEDD